MYDKIHYKLKKKKRKNKQTKKNNKKKLNIQKTKKKKKKQRLHLAKKGPSSQSYGFSSSHIWVWELDHKESWAQKNWCFLAVLLEKTLESPLNYREIKPVNLKGNQPEY